MRPFRPPKSSILGALALIALALLVAPVALATPLTGGTLAYQLYQKPAGIDPMHTTMPQDCVPLGALFDGLTSLDATSSAVLPAAAVTWEPNADASVWTFHLREGATFSNGAPVTARDFKVAWEGLLKGAGRGWGVYQLNRVKGAAALARGKAKHLSGVAARDASTLVVTLTAPFADFPSIVAGPSLGPVPHALVSTARKAAKFRNAPVGNGPFMLSKPWGGKDTIAMVANPRYYGTSPHIAGITFTVIEDAAAAYEQFKAGRLDVSVFPSASLAEARATYGTSLDGFTSQPGHQVVPGPIAGVLWTVFNTKKAPFDDVLVRRAFSLAIDRAKLLAEMMPPAPMSMETTATDVLSPGIAGYDPGRWLYARLDQAQAAALLAEAGYPGGAGLPEVTLLTSNAANKTGYKTSLAAIGVNVKLVEVTQARFWPEWRTGDYMVCQDGWNYYATAATVLSNSFTSSLDGSESFYSDPAVDAAIAQANATLDDAARLAAFESIDATVAAATPVAPVGYFSRTIVCSARLHDAVLSPMDLFDFTRVSIE